MEKRPGQRQNAATSGATGQSKNASGSAGRGESPGAGRAEGGQSRRGTWGGGGGRGGRGGEGGGGGRGGGGHRSGAAERVQEAGGRNGGRGGRGRGGGGSRGRAGRGRNSGGCDNRGGGGYGGANGHRWGDYSLDRRGGRPEGRDDVEQRQRHGPRSQSVGKPETRKGGGLGFKRLQELSIMEPYEVAISVSSHPALKTLLAEPMMRQDLLELLCLVLSIAFRSRANRSSLQHLAGLIKDSSFLRTVLPHYLAGIVSESVAARREQYPKHLENILVILTQVLSIFPASSVHSVSLLLTLLPAALCSLRTSGVDVPAQIEENMGHLKHLVEHLQTRSREGTLRSDKDTYALLPVGRENPEPDEAQQDFRTIPIYPTPEELRQEDRPYLRPNLTSQRYRNTHLYLDTHFRLLREDFVRPLREGIQELLWTQMNIGRVDNPANQVTGKRLDDIRMYHDTKIIAPKCTVNGLAYVVQFNVEPLKFVRWENSKRLIFGSLVCLSCDNFESFLFATVADRDPKELQKGIVQIIFTEQSRKRLAGIEQNQMFLMVETTAYFEAYRYVLEGLQEQEEDELPFQRYLVDCSPDVQSPVYLRRSDTYDLSSVAHPDFKKKVKPFHCLDSKAWPEMEELGLDESQFKAFQLALTKELAIIQGPPGTGKTYVGLKIAQALLTNQSLWRMNSPILVVCYTNHALDQFLEGIHKFLPDGIVRVGGRSSSEILKRFNLRELAHKEKSRRQGSNHLSAAFNTIYRELCEAERRLQVQGIQLECSVKGVLRENVLQKYMSDKHWASLRAVQNAGGFEMVAGRKLNVIMEWLGLDGLVHHGGSVNTAESYDMEVEAARELDEEILIDIAEEADMTAAERLIDDFIYSKGERDKKGETAQTVREVESLMLAMSLDEPETQPEAAAEMNEEVWERTQKENLKKRIKRELNDSSSITPEEEKSFSDVWSLRIQDRWKLYRLWICRYQMELRTKTLDLEEEYQNSVDRLADVKRQPDRCLPKEEIIYKELCEAERRLQVQGIQLECSVKGVLRETFLQKYMSDKHWASLRAVQNAGGFEMVAGRKLNLIMEWLGLDGLVHHGGSVNTAESYDMEVEAAGELDEEILIDIAEEADMMAAERIIDDFIYSKGERDKKGETAQTVREVESLMLAMSLDEPEAQPEAAPRLNEEVWELQRSQKRNLKIKIKRELNKSSSMTPEEEEEETDVWRLRIQDRWKLYRLWISRYRMELRTKTLDLEEEYQNSVDRLADVKQQQDCRILKDAIVIGMTTTGAAKFRHTLQQVRPSLVIVEEAAEVLEAHTITTLSSACQHLILIGDHQQLRPSATVYELAKNFNLEMSMFERLVNMELPFSRLNYQHRMRPDIACLLTPHIYTELENHPSVLEYENIKGLNTNLFFVEHKQLEEGIRDGKSHANKHEAQFVVALCRYLLLQEYKPEQITILTTYTGQLFCLRKLMPASQFSGVKVHVVDKYQGEENDIVLLSLVRSNLQRRVGFLNIPNRVCVALSRAKKGLYCIGNSEMLCQVKLWSNIFHTLREKDQIGTALTLCCQNHPSRQVSAACAEDFKQAPEGGCTQPCEYRLECGHVCTKVCHPSDSEHKNYQCMKKCQKTLCDLGHRCTRLCYEECGSCNVLVEKTLPQCQHKQMVPCHQDPVTFGCQEPCPKTLRCGHPCDRVCGKSCTASCKVKIHYELKCGHRKDDYCFYKTQQKEPVCTTPCEQQLKCGHVCPGNCSLCHSGRYHCDCSHKCERLLICSHKCQSPCTTCPPCARKCENRCVHSQCSSPCGQPCSPCVEPCAWQCPHQTCTKLCHEPCDRPPCNEPCDKNLSCRHPCIGLCGEKCPDKCRVCHREEVTEIFFGFEDDPESRFIQLQDCGHVVERRALDQFMQMDQTLQENEEEVAIKLKECPRCRTPIRKNLRYGSHINRCLAEIELVKQKIAGEREDIQTQAWALQQRWEENRHRTCLTVLPTEYHEIEDKLISFHLSAFDLWIVENKMDFFSRVAELMELERKKISPAEGAMFKEQIKTFLGWLKDRQQRFTEQQVHDLQRELRRLTLLAELNAHCNALQLRGDRLKIQMEEETLRNVLNKCGQFTEDDEAGVKQILEGLKEKFPLTGLGISEDERKMIVSAIQMPGHWFKCPNGHVYLISDCGGAMESSKCPDCNAVIGGASHRVASGNQLASEMDGAQTPAWQTALQPL